MFSNVKNEKLKKSIREAKNMINGNNDENLTDITENNSTKNEIEDLDKKQCKFEINIENNYYKDDEINLNENNFLGKKIDRELNEKDILLKIKKYFIFISKLIESNNIQQIKNEEKSFKKILDLFSKLKIDNIHYFIYDSEICKFIIFFKECDKHLSKDIQIQIEIASFEILSFLPKKSILIDIKHDSEPQIHCKRDIKINIYHDNFVKPKVSIY